ncbi:acyltransferase [Nocardiopsis sp. JB363]|uniref:acyltransferase family protein n=1 Tax=Nocardiopsis sp. JB363 TaxID=1434837 RepID=UPI00097AC39D|nr:acyltransferase [Nocardiopsis sp. JB363]SIO84717.1 hypothetical protein BQ8420_03315 [Nocardiopsis sp. JB363]
MAQNISPSITGAADRPTRPRLFYVDHLRVVLTVLVVLHHAAITYGNIPVWYFSEPAQDPSGLALDLFVLFNQTFFMGMFFLIAGYFVPGSIDRRGRRGFMRERLIRLGVPLLLFLVLLRPLVLVPAFGQALASDPDTPLWLLYLLTIDPGPMWFVEVLLVMSLVYVLVRGVRERRSQPVPVVAEVRERGPVRWLVPVLVFAVGLALVTFAWRWAFPAPYWPVVGLPSPGYLPQYVAMFTVGALAYRGDWLHRLPSRAGVVGGIAAVVVLPVMVLFVTAAPGTGASLVHLVAENLFSVGVMLALLVFFRRFVARDHRVWRFLGDNAFAVYVLHAVVLVAIAMALSGWEVAAVVKFAALAALSVPLTWALAAGVRAIPGVARVL